MVAGNLCRIRGEEKYEWKIKDFLLCPDERDVQYASPEFSFSGVSWAIEIFNSRTGIFPQTQIFIRRLGDLTFNVDFSLSLKTVEGKSVQFRTGTITKNSFKCGIQNFMPRSELIQRKRELLPSGALTVICTLKYHDGNGKEATCVDAFAQTSQDTGKKDVCVNTFSQTDQETGVWKLQHHLKEILLTGNVSDIVLRVGDQEFKSHWCILAARSPVFLAMTTHDSKEKNSGVVDIPDVDSNTFSGFLKYLYTGSVDNVTSENVAKLYIVADKYQVDELKESCLDFMLKNITVNSFCDFLTLSLLHVEKELTDACSQYFNKNELAIILTPKWQAFLTENPIAGNELHIKKLTQMNK